MNADNDLTILFQLPSHVQWGSNPGNVGVQGQKTLAEIQEQEERERLEMEMVITFLQHESGKEGTKLKNVTKDPLVKSPVL